ncbi:hypothetical protein ACQEU3_03440 [Spirillospora sp. CA-253888]
MSVTPLSDRDPRAVGGHRLLGRLGEGGQGTVYLAETGTGGQVAIKMLHAAGRATAVARTWPTRARHAGRTTRPPHYRHDGPEPSPSTP